MKDDKRPRFARDALVFAGIMALAIALSMALSGLHNDNNPFATPLFILAVALVARLTDGYLWGIAASLVGTFCVNYMFTYPFWQFDVTLTGYPLTFLMMLVVSVIISALTTQIKRQEQLRFEMEREKMHANLLRAIAHDIRTPLASIMGASSALKAQALEPADREALLDGINRDAQWLVRVTENLLSVTRFTGGDVALAKTDEVLEEIVGSAILKYRRAPDALPVQVTQPEQILIVPMDATLIEQVLINLMENAVLHGISRLPGGGTIVIALSCVDGQLRIRVHNPAPDPQGRALPLTQGAGHAQRSIAHRLAWRFGPAARMTGAWSDGYYACDITVPVP